MVPNQSGPWNPRSFVPQQSMLGTSANVVPGVPQFTFLEGSEGSKHLWGDSSGSKTLKFTVPRFRISKVLQDSKVPEVVGIAGFQDYKVVKLY